MKIQTIPVFIMIVVISSCVPVNATVQTETVTIPEATLTTTPAITRPENIVSPTITANPTSTFAPASIASSTISPLNLEGTGWTGIDSDGDYYVYEFLSGGVLKYTSPNGIFTNGTWRQDGNSVYFETNNRFSEYEGIINGDSIAGNAWNQDGHVWTWTAERQ